MVATRLIDKSVAEGAVADRVVILVKGRIVFEGTRGSCALMPR